MNQLKAALALAAALSTASPAGAQTPPARTPPNAPGTGDRNSCFYVNQIESNHALGDRAVIFRVNLHDFYRLDFANRCTPLTYPTPKLIITPFGGDELVCHAIDLDIKVGDQGPGSIPEACIPSSLHRMSAAEVAAVPKKDLP